MNMQTRPLTYSAIKQATSAIQHRVQALILGKFGRLEDDLSASGLVDSLGAIELLLLLQEEFRIPLADVTLKDLSSVARIVSVIEAAMFTCRSQATDGKPVPALRVGDVDGPDVSSNPVRAVRGRHYLPLHERRGDAKTLESDCRSLSDLQAGSAS